jgi:phosphopantothenoylcysteine decarboxylase/phosphopantothenate--cysteine ligase
MRKTLSVLITSGPTREYLDPVRFLSNASSGAMGFALAAAAHQYGASVTVISGPTSLVSPTGVKVISVISAREMRRETLRLSKAADIVIAAAAVSDWSFEKQSTHKLKRGPGKIRLTLVPNPDIIKDAASRRRPGQVFVGFALETRRAVEHARVKLLNKNLDLIVLNGPENLSSDRARVSLVTRESVEDVPRALKARVARAIFLKAVKLFEYQA